MSHYLDSANVSQPPLIRLQALNAFRYSWKRRIIVSTFKLVLGLNKLLASVEFFRAIFFKYHFLHNQYQWWCIISFSCDRCLYFQATTVCVLFHIVWSTSTHEILNQGRIVLVRDCIWGGTHNIDSKKLTMLLIWQRK